jgi:hypothetical protein
MLINSNPLDIAKLVTKRSSEPTTIEMHVVERHVDRSNESCVPRWAILDPPIKCSIAIEPEGVERVDEWCSFKVQLATYTSESESRANECTREVCGGMERADVKAGPGRPRSPVAAMTDVDLMVSHDVLPDDVPDLSGKLE